MLGLLHLHPAQLGTLRRRRRVREVDVVVELDVSPPPRALPVVSREVAIALRAGRLSLPMPPRVAAMAETRVLARGRGADPPTRHTSHLAHLGTSRCRRCMQHVGAAVELDVPPPPRTPPVVCRKVAAVL